MIWVAVVGVGALGFLAYALAAISADAEKRWEQIKEEREMANYEDDARQVEVLLYENLTAKQFEEYEHYSEIGAWTKVPYNNRIWGVGDGYFDAYEVDLNAGTVRENVYL